MLAAQGIINPADAAEILSGLERVREEIASGRFAFKQELEDIHMNVEARLRDLIGDAAGRLHTARSRNDQVATDFRLWVRDAFDRIDAGLLALQTVLIDQAERHADTVMPGFTHLQSAQPVTFGHHLLAYVEMFGRDRGRAMDGRRRLNECPLGAAALAGTSFPIDRAATAAAALGFDRPAANSLDAVSDRDFALEYLGCTSLCAVHVSRLAEEIVLWTSDAFAFVRLSDAFTTGSSIMPQKRNPDAAELARAKSGRIVGHLAGLLTTMKGLPLAYAKDMQEDKEPVFDTDEALMLCLAAMTGMMADLDVDRRSHAPGGRGRLSRRRPILPTGWCGSLGHAVPPRPCHVTGQLVRLAETSGCGLWRSFRWMSHAYDRAADDRRGLRRPVGGRVGRQPRQPWRDRAAIASPRRLPRPESDSYEPREFGTSHRAGDA